MFFGWPCSRVLLRAFSLAREGGYGGRLTEQICICMAYFGCGTGAYAFQVIGFWVGSGGIILFCAFCMSFDIL